MEPLAKRRRGSSKGAQIIDEREEQLESLRDFMAQHRRLPELGEMWPRRTAEGLRKWHVGVWVGSLQQTGNAGALSAGLVADLEAIPGWNWGSQSQFRHGVCDAWEMNYAALQQYSEKHNALPGDGMVWVKDGIIFYLGDWVNSQRTRNTKGFMSEYHAEKLEQLPGWNWETVDWSMWLAVLREYIESHNKLPGVADEWGFPGLQQNWPIGKWAYRCEVAYKNGVMPQEQIVALESVPGWNWTGSRKVHRTWDQWLGILRKQLAMYGNLPSLKTVYTVAGTDGKPEKWNIGEWISDQRYEYKHGTLSKDRVRKLEAIDGWYWSLRTIKTPAAAQNGAGETGAN